MTALQFASDGPLTDPVEVAARLGTAGFVRDTEVCVCGHRCASHGSSDSGIGMGGCGLECCGCVRFAGTGSFSIEPIHPTAEELAYFEMFGRSA